LGIIGEYLLTQNNSTSSIDSIYNLMGQIVSVFGLLESTIIWSFSQVSKIEHGLLLSIIAGENFEIILKMFDSAFAYLVKDETLQKEFNELLIELRDINRRRSLCIHSTWYPSENKFFKIIKFAKGGKGKPAKITPSDIDTIELDKLLQNIYNAITKIAKFTTTHFPERKNEKSQETETEAKS
jgi:hypothetical protein